MPMIDLHYVFIVTSQIFNQIIGLIYIKTTVLLFSCDQNGSLLYSIAASCTKQSQQN